MSYGTTEAQGKGHLHRVTRLWNPGELRWHSASLLLYDSVSGVEHVRDVYPQGVLLGQGCYRARSPLRIVFFFFSF